MENSFIIIGIIIFVIIMIIINSKNKPYSVDDYHNEIMKDYNEEKWIKYQESEEFKNNNL